MRARQTVRPFCVLLASLVATGCVDETAEEEPPAPIPSDGEIHTANTATIDTAFGPREVEYEVVDGMAVFEGDIVLGRADELARSGGRVRSAGRSNTAFRWQGAMVPYEIAAGFSTAQVEQINAAVAHWGNNTPYWFKPHNGEADYIRFVPSTKCQSSVGRVPGGQVIELAPGCGTGSAIHEIGHAIGLWHEQSRVDRDNFVTIHWENILEDKKHNFQTYVQQGEDGRDLFNYDAGSIMHYGSFFSSKNDQPTITRTDGSLITANRSALTPTDIAGAVKVLTHDPGQSTFMLRNVNSSRCMDVEAGSTNNGAFVNQWDCHGLGNQRWYFWTMPGTSDVLVINEGSGHCLDIPFASVALGERLTQYACHAFTNQRFRRIEANGGFMLQNVNSGMCLDVAWASTELGASIIQWDCHGGPNQLWTQVF